MRFKSIVVLFSVLVTLVFTACDRFTKSSTTSGVYKDVIVVQSKELECLNAWPEQVKFYFQDQLSDGQTSQIFTCVDGALGVFEKFARGDNPNQFSATELRQFLNRYMLKNQISESFMAQLMKLKILLLGGNKDFMTKEELAHSHQLIATFSQEGLLLRGRWKTLLFDEDPKKIDLNDLIETHTRAKKALADIIDFSHADQSNYNWTDFIGLFGEMESYMSAGDLLANIKKWMPLTESLRLLFLGKETLASTKSGWQETGVWTADVYGWVAKIFYRMRKPDLHSTSTWIDLMSLADSSLELLNNSPQMRTVKVLSVSHLDAVIDEANKLKLVPTGLSPLVVKQTYRHFFAILKQGEQLTGASSVDWRTIKGFDGDMLAHLKLEYQIWKLAENQISQDFKDKADHSLSAMITHWKSFDLQAATREWNLDFSAQQKMARSWSDWMQILESPNPLTFKNGVFLQIPATPKTATVNFYSLTVLNSLRTFVRLMEMGYGLKKNQQDDVWDRVMTKATIQKWDNDFEAFGQGIHFLDPRQNNSVSRFYNDSIFFTFSSLGSPTINAQQTLELISLMLSGGKAVADQVMLKLKKDHCLTAKKDPSFQQPMVDQKCFEQSFKNNFSGLFYNLPNLVSEVHANRMSLDTVLGLLETIAKENIKPAGLIEYGEIRTMGGVLDYLEALMAVYDSNHDQFLTQEELLVAYPRFKNIVSTVSPLKDWFNEDAFLYVVYRGKMPSTSTISSGFSSAADFASFVVERRLGLPKVSRMNLLRVIAVLKANSK